MKHNSNYTITVACYFWPDGNPDEVVRMTAVVKDVFSHHTIEMHEFWTDDIPLSAILKRINVVADKYKATQTFIDEAFPLTQCQCCDKYVMVCGPAEEDALTT